MLLTEVRCREGIDMTHLQEPERTMNPQSEGPIRIHALLCGLVGVDPAVPFRDISKNPVAYTGLFRSTKRRIWLPVNTYLVEHPKGLLLFDTAWHTEVREHPISHLSFPLWFASKPKLPKEQAVTEQLSTLGYHPGDLDYVLLSHMDVDHVSGLELVKDAKHIWASREELKAAKGSNPRYVNKKLWKGIPVEPIPFTQDPTAPYGMSCDVFDDGTIKVIFAPGHSAGSIVLQVQRGNRFVLLVGDTGYAKDSWEQGRLPGPVYSRDKLLKSLEWVFSMSRRNGCVEVLACHDPEITQHTITL